MSKIKHISRAGWVIVGLVAALLLVPSMAVAATVTYNGIEGSNGTTTTQNKAQVTSAGQLLTTGAEPSSYVEYALDMYGIGGAICRTAATIPTGKAFIAEQIEVDAFAVNSPSSYSSPADGLASSAESLVFADGPAYAGVCDNYFMASADAQSGTVGNAAIPLSPGFVVPSGYALDFEVSGMDAEIFVTGYLVPSADAPSTPSVKRMQTNIAGQQLHLSHR